MHSPPVPVLFIVFFLFHLRSCVERVPSSLLLTALKWRKMLCALLNTPGTTRSPRAPLYNCDCLFHKVSVPTRCFAMIVSWILLPHGACILVYSRLSQSVSHSTQAVFSFSWYALCYYTNPQGDDVFCFSGLNGRQELGTAVSSP